MVLRDIELDTPSFLQNGTLSEDVLEVLRKKKLEFRLQTRCMTSMLSRILPKIQISDFQRIRIICSEELSFSSVIIDAPICRVNVPFDFKRFSASDDYEKKAMIIETIENAVGVIEQELKIRLDAIKETIQSVRMLDYENIWIWKEKKLKGKHIGVEVRHLVDKVVIKLFCKSNNEIIAQKSIEDVPTEWSYARLLGKMVVSDNKAMLLDDMEKEVLRISWK